VGGAILTDIYEGRVTRVVEVTRGQYDDAEMKEALVNFCFQYLLRDVNGNAMHRMFSFYPTIDMCEATVE